MKKHFTENSKEMCWVNADSPVMISGTRRPNRACALYLSRLLCLPPRSSLMPGLTKQGTHPPLAQLFLPQRDTLGAGTCHRLSSTRQHLQTAHKHECHRHLWWPTKMAILNAHCWTPMKWAHGMEAAKTFANTHTRMHTWTHVYANMHAPMHARTRMKRSELFSFQQKRLASYFLKRRTDP